jgi:DNA-binding NtrC family response regulator
MSERLFAILIHNHPEPFDSLRRVLKELSVETYSVDTCKQAQELINDCQPHLIFAESCVADGSWVSILNMAEAEAVPLNVIVVAALPDMGFYLSVMERGAFDFIAPPFEHEPMKFLVKSAARDCHRRREASARMAIA